VTEQQATSPQAISNANAWAAGEHLAIYANRILSPVEVLIFARYREQLSGRVLDVGCGAGRVLSYLIMFGAEAHGIDLAPKMVEYCKRACPSADVHVGDVSALGECVEGLFDVVIAPDNLIDVFGDAERRRVLAGMREVIAPGGLLVFSTHDLAYVDANPGPPEWEAPSRSSTIRKFVERSPAEIVRAVRRRRREASNRRRLGPLQERNADHAIINDFPHDYSLLHYYIRRDDQERQLAELQFELLECLDADGNTVARGGTGRTDSLYYIAQPA
jgi:SAM-dependent methyltransferase